MSALSVVLALAWALISVQSIRVMRGGGALVFGCAALGLAFLAGASALAGLATVALVCLGAALALAAMGFAAKTVREDWSTWTAGVLVAACGGYAILNGIAPLVALLCIFPLAFDAASTFLWRRLYQPDAPPFYQIGLKANLGAKSINAAYWLMSVHCGLIAVVASEVHRGAAAMSGQTSAMMAKLIRIAAYTPQIAFILLVLISWQISSAIRNMARAAEADAAQ